MADINHREIIKMEKYMRIALDLAQKGEGRVNPNPLVGAVVVKNDEIIGSGYHQFFGGAHAEIYAIDEAGENAKDSEIYVTLEPCSHYGKTPPCVDKVIESGIKKCVIALKDPNPLVAGRGISKLKAHGIEVVVGILEHKALEQNRVFFKNMATTLPYIFVKCGITLDGKIATKTGDSKWITNEKSREKVHKLRNKFMGIMVGEKTFINDNPSLTARIDNGVNPYRILLLPNLEKIIKEDSATVFNSNAVKLSKEDSKTIIVTDKSKANREIKLLEQEYNIRFIFMDGKEYQLKEVFERIAKLKIDSVLIEGGSSLISAVFRDNLFDEGEVFIAPKITGDSSAISFANGFNITNMSEAINLENIQINTYGDNVSFAFTKTQRKF